MELTADQAAWLKERMYALIPDSGKAIGNIALRRKLATETKGKIAGALSSDDYWFIRNQLIADGKIVKGGGLGGSVRRAAAVGEADQARSQTKAVAREVDLYEPFCGTISAMFTKDRQITSFVCQVTAHQGGKQTGGQWTRPDITLVAVRVFQFVPGKMLEVVTFEVKPLNSFGIGGVFETAAHSVFANKCYLAIQVPKGDVASDDLSRLERECKRFGVGLFTFVNPKDWDTFDEVVEAAHRVPDPAELSTFINTQISEENKRKILDLTH
jgi:hypothetical protein